MGLEGYIETTSLQWEKESNPSALTAPPPPSPPRCACACASSMRMHKHKHKITGSAKTKPVPGHESKEGVIETQL